MGWFAARWGKRWVRGRLKPFCKHPEGRSGFGGAAAKPRLKPGPRIGLLKQAVGGGVVLRGGDYLEWWGGFGVAGLVLVVDGRDDRAVSGATAVQMAYGDKAAGCGEPALPVIASLTTNSSFRLLA